MNDQPQQPPQVPPHINTSYALARCAICGTTRQLLRCAKCKTIFYCSIEHQHVDWPIHKQKCRLLAKQKQQQQQQLQQQSNNNNNNTNKMQQLQMAVAATNLNGGEVQQQQQQQQQQQPILSFDSFTDDDSIFNLLDNVEQSTATATAATTADNQTQQRFMRFSPQQQQQPQQQQHRQQTMNYDYYDNSNLTITTTSMEPLRQQQFNHEMVDANFDNLLSSDAIVDHISNSVNDITSPFSTKATEMGATGLPNTTEAGTMGHPYAYSQAQQQLHQQSQFNPQWSNPQNNQYEKTSSYEIGSSAASAAEAPSVMGCGNVNERRYEDLCRNIISDMNQYGLSVVDDFLGREKGIQILNEVHQMYNAGVFQDGQLVNKQKSEQDLRTIRGDKITWVKGIEPGCSNVGYLINQIDAVIFKANTMKNNGKLGNYNIKERTKAMVACYPGSGARYVMHIDNPNKDGRVITAIYYLNVDWDTKLNGGVLRIFPEHGNSVAEIEPKFDRLIFFWSDKRNPHEVQPAHRTRYAITVWYFDANEREAALNRCKNNKIPNAMTATAATAGGGATTTATANLIKENNINFTTAAATTTTKATNYNNKNVIDNMTRTTVMMNTHKNCANGVGEVVVNGKCRSRGAAALASTAGDYSSRPISSSPSSSPAANAHATATATTANKICT